METPPHLEAASQIPTTDGGALHARHVVANRYEIVSRLGTGGMGEVWRGYDLKLRVDVALKSLRLDLLRKAADLEETLRREVRIAREVASPNVCRIFDLVVEDNQELISMEYIDGATLLSVLLQNGPMELRQARDIAAQFLAGLEAIHNAGLVHRDLKPENIMITRAGRVVVMDFGIAKQSTQTAGTISGTLPYMSPEQLAGEKVDARSDVFSAGIVLAEMIHPEGILSYQTREGIWNIVREHPMQLPDGPWKGVIMRAVERNPEARYSSAGELSRALEEATYRVDTFEERKPYPGLASFTAADAEYFFGRELEVEIAIKKLQQLQMMALVGPSGAGKTSFLRAGLIPSLPQGWNQIFCVPGDSPLLNLGQALIPQLAGDTEAMQQILRFEDRSVAISLLNRWRNKHADAVLVIDRFEELFTLNSPDVQSRFAELIASVALESDVRVILSMRDDFLLRCYDYSSLGPIFSELTPLGPLAGSALRRALVQPALKCGYRFEDETLVDEILADIEKERGALPLMAFAAARLWEKRDRQNGQLTRQAYQEIGGVAGALAQHAENTMNRIGSDRQPVVREIFRNLITADNTRTARDTEELLSVFPEKAVAEDVLRILVDARLLTSFEAPAAEGDKSKRRVEIIHESLLTKWPRLVRWQTQDADSAQLRDQLRQAAQLWEQRNRSEDLLWTGTALLEFQVWRQRYPGGLTTTEEAFAGAMLERANRKRRKRRILVATAFVVLLGILAVVSNFWRQATVARDKAVSESRRADAGRVLAIGRAVPNADPATKLAYAIASLEFAETSQARRFALQAISEGPAAQVLEIGNHFRSEISPDSKWIAITRSDGKVELLPRNGTKPVAVQETFKPGNFTPWPSQFSPDSKLLIWSWRASPNIVKAWSIPEKKLIRTFTFEGITKCLVRDGKAFLITDTGGKLGPPFLWNQSKIRVWQFDEKEPQEIGQLNLGGNFENFFDIDSPGKSIFYIKNHEIYRREIDGFKIGPKRLVFRHSEDITIYGSSFALDPKANELAFSDVNGDLRLLSLIPEARDPVRLISGKAMPGMYDPSGNFLFALKERGIARWDLTAGDAEPQLFRSPNETRSVNFDHKNGSIVGATESTVEFFPLTKKYPYIYSSRTSDVRFSPDGKFLISGFSPGRNIDGVMIWSLPQQTASDIRVLWQSNQWNATSLDIHPSGEFVLAATPGDGIHQLSLIDAIDSKLKSVSRGSYGAVVISPDGVFAAALANDGYIEVWDLKTGASRILEQSRGKDIFSLRFAPDGSLFSGGPQLYRWNLKDDSVKVLKEYNDSHVRYLAVSKTGRYLATVSRLRSTDSTANRIFRLDLYDLQQGKSTQISSHGNRIFSVAFDPAETRLITGDLDGIVRVGPITGKAPHLLLGHSSAVRDIAVDPDGKWIASRESVPGVRLWPMPEGKPLDALSYPDFLNHLRSLTNVRAVPENSSPTGYRIDYGSNPDGSSK